MVEFDILYGEGISLAGELLDMGLEVGMIRKAGSWSSMGEERIGQGRENARIYLLEHPEAMDMLRQKVLEANGLGEPAPAAKGEA
jgi:recombination protein RecA